MNRLLIKLLLTTSALFYTVVATAETQYTNDIQQLYIAYFNRPADPQALQFWTSIMDAQTAGGQDPKEALSGISKVFGNSEEWKLLGGSTLAPQVGNIYRNLFGSELSPDAIGYFVERIKSREMTLTDFFQACVKGEVKGDMNVLDNKVIAANRFTNAIDPREYNVDIARDYLSRIDANPQTLSIVASPDAIAAIKLLISNPDVALTDKIDAMANMVSDLLNAAHRDVIENTIRDASGTAAETYISEHM